jgi:hypothetical protein
VTLAMPARRVWFVLAPVSLAMTALAVPAPARAGCAPATRAVIAEVFYDALGDDTGHEFVELFDPHDAPVPLAGLRLEAGDGAAPGRWTLRWTGASGDTIRPHARFVIGGTLVIPAPDAIANLDLQNGPDAVRIVWPDGAIEVVGYGALSAPEYFCGAPAPDVESGRSLTRFPDAADLGSNALDFRAASPTPGRANQPVLDLAMVAGSLVTPVVRPGAGESLVLHGLVANRGLEATSAGAAAITPGWRIEDATTWMEPVPLAAIAPGDTADFALATGALPEGRLTLLARVGLVGDEDPDDDLDSLRVRVGTPPLALAEIQFHPADDAGEWVELLAWNRAPVDPAGYALSDRTGTTATASGGRVLAPGERVVLAQHRAALVAAHGLDSTRVLEAAPWPSLNNTNAADGVADVVTLAEPDGTPCDRFGYSASGLPSDVPVERVDDTHWLAGIPGGTPLAPPRAPPTLTRRFEAHPTRIVAGATQARLAWQVPWAWCTLSVRAFDLAGRDAGIVLPRAERSGHAEADWDPSGLPAGVYLLVLEADPGTGSGLNATAAIRIVKRVP